MERPRYSSVLWSLVAPWIATAILLVFAGAGLAQLTGMEVAQGQSVPWLFPLDGPWGWLANAPLLVLGLVLLTSLTRRGLPRGEHGERVALWPLAAALAATAVLATIPRSAEADGGAALAAWLIAAWLIRRLPWRPDDAPVRPARERALRVAAIGAGVLALLPLSLTYADRYPLVVTGSSCVATAMTSDCSLVDGRAVRLAVEVHNTGHEPVTVTGVRLLGLQPGLQPGGGRLVPEQGRTRALTFPQTIAGRGTLHLQLRVRVGRDACAGLDGGPLATGLTVRTTARGQRLKLQTSALEPGECLTP